MRQYSCWLCLLSILLTISSLQAQSVRTSIGWYNLGHSKLDGLGFEIQFQKSIKERWLFGLRSQMIHAAGSRDFSYVDGERYTIADPDKPETFYDPESVPPGLLDPEEFIATFGLLPDRTTQVSYGIVGGYIVRSDVGTFEIVLSPALASVHKKYVAAATKGEFTNLIGPFEGVNLLSVFVNDYLDVSLSARVNYSLRNDRKFHPGISFQIEYLTSGYWNYGVGLRLIFGTS